MSQDLQRRIDAQVLEGARVRATPLWWAERLVPRPLAVAFFCVGLCAMVPWVAIVLIPPEGGGVNVDALLGATFFMALPSFGAGGVVALVFAGSSGARAVLGVAGSVLTALVGALMFLVAWAYDRDATGLIIVLTVMALLAPVALSLLFGGIAAVQARIALLDERASQLLRLLAHFGSLDDAVVAEALGVDVTGISDVARRAHAINPLERAHGRLWTSARLRAHQALLLARLESGERSLAALVEQVGEPEPVLRAWLGGFAADGLHDTALDGDTVVVRSEAEQSPCGGCGGSMRLVGRALWRCLHCGNERASVTRSAG